MFLSDTFCIYQTKIAVTEMLFWFTPHPKISPFLSGLEMFLQSYSTQWGATFFFLDHQEELENMLYKHALQKMNLMSLTSK